MSVMSTTQKNQFVRDGYLVLPNLLSNKEVDSLRAVTEQHLEQRITPYELETDVLYPGAPESEGSLGGSTIRRLLHAYDRDPEFQGCAQHPAILAAIKTLLSAQKVFLTPNHHNCVMTKQPEFSSQTNWHRDTRYWHFNNKYLINAWYALGDESADNGGMLVLPGSHRWDVDANVLDEAQFLIEDHPSNQARLSLAEQVDLQAGDCLLFSAHCFHAAGANRTKQSKYSLVFTYHSEGTHSIAGSKSSELPSIELD